MSTFIKKYFAIMRIGWLDALAYRTEFFVSVVGWGIRLFIGVFLWRAVTESRGGTIGAYTLETIITYLLIIQIISGFVFSRVGFDIANDIYRGDFANFLVRPVNYLALRAFHEMSKNVFRTSIGVLLFGGIIIVAGGITLNWWKLPLVILTLIGAYLINYAIVACLALSAFWIVNSKRLMFIYFGLLSIFSGMIVPIDLFPPHIAAIVRWLPFPYIFYLPAKSMQASQLSAELTHGLALQLLYIGILGIVTHSFYRLGVARFEGSGQ